jgi:hypothetical protein
MFAIWVRIELHVHASHGSSADARKPEAKDALRITAMFVFYILQKKKNA